MPRSFQHFAALTVFICACSSDPSQDADTDTADTSVSDPAESETSASAEPDSADTDRADTDRADTDRADTNTTEPECVSACICAQGEGCTGGRCTRVQFLCEDGHLL